MKNIGSINKPLVGLINRVQHYQHNYRSRKQLLKLDERALKDIGLSRADALREGQTPFWITGQSRFHRSLKVQPVAVLLSIFCLVSMIFVVGW